jgi:hypothetical protein
MKNLLLKWDQGLQGQFLKTKGTSQSIKHARNKSEN